MRMITMTDDEYEAWNASYSKVVSFAKAAFSNYNAPDRAVLEKAFAAMDKCNIDLHIYVCVADQSGGP